MNLSVLTLAAGRLTHLDRLLDGLGRQTVAPDEIVVVDLGGDDALDQVVAGRARRVVKTPHDPSGVLHLAGARNQAAGEANGDLLVFLDVDVIPARDLVARYRNVLHTCPGALACGPVRYLRPGWLDVADPTNEVQLDRASDPPRSRPAPPAGVELNSDHELFWSLSFGVTRTTWRRIGGFDEGYRGYGAEDTDLGLRARAHGVPLAWFVGGVAYHQWHPASRHDARHLAALVANARRFRARWGSWPMRGWLEELHQLGRLRFDPCADTLEIVA